MNHHYAKCNNDTIIAFSDMVPGVRTPGCTYVKAYGRPQIKQNLNRFLQSNRTINEINQPVVLSTSFQTLPLKLVAVEVRYTANEVQSPKLSRIRATHPAS